MRRQSVFCLVKMLLLLRGSSFAFRPRSAAQASRLVTAGLSSSASLSVPPEDAAPPATTSVNGIRCFSHYITVPLDHQRPDSSDSDSTLDVFVREIVAEKDASSLEARQSLPPLLYLQGGPGFPAPRPTFPLSGWMDAALKQGFRLLLLDQRGTGLSSPITTASLQQRFFSQDGNTAGNDEAYTATKVANYVSLFRADSIVRDCELVRQKLCPEGQKVTLLGQSFGGFCILSYLSLFPNSLERCLFTFGLAPVLQRGADPVYAATYERMKTRNRRFYERYPGDRALVRRIAVHLRSADEAGASVALPTGSKLTLRRFLMSGLALGSADGMERLHFILEDAWSESEDRLSASFLKAMDDLHSFETNPLYWMLHEAIYCDGPSLASRWAAERVRQSIKAPLIKKKRGGGGDAVEANTEAVETWYFDPDWVLDSDGDSEDATPTNPLYFTGEMVFPWMGDGDFAALAPLWPAAQVLAQKFDWPYLYNVEALRTIGVEGKIPCAALISYDDIYVERHFSEETADLINCKVWITNEFQHSGLRDCPSRVFTTLLQMSKGEVALPS